MGTFIFQWHITDSCVNRCNHCYIKNFGKNNVSLETAFDIIDDMKECCDQLGATPVISITGGDPLVHPFVWEILKKAKSIGGQLGILGNPELLNDEVVRQLMETGVRQYQISLDGMQNTHDNIRSRGSFRRSSEAISLLARLGLQINVMSTVSSANYLEMVDVMKHAYILGAKRWSFARYTPDDGDCGISSNEYRSFLELIASEHNAFTQKEISVPMKEPLMSAIVSQPVDSDCIVSGCGLGSSMLSILPDNTMMACRRHADSVLGKWEKPGDLLNTFLFHSKMDTYRKIKQIEGCGTCNLLNQCRGCRAAAFAATGNIFGRDPQCFAGGN